MIAVPVVLQKMTGKDQHHLTDAEERGS